jgi:glycosyltransferase involved in cell wall biosynthesis
LKNHDAFITASENDPCSNSLVESLTCGLPVIALNSGGHPELVKEGGVLFNNETDLIEKITMLFDDLENYKKNISIDSIDQVVEKYIMFFEKLLQGDKNG